MLGLIFPFSHFGWQRPPVGLLRANRNDNSVGSVLGRQNIAHYLGVPSCNCLGLPAYVAVVVREVAVKLRIAGPWNTSIHVTN